MMARQSLIMHDNDATLPLPAQRGKRRLKEIIDLTEDSIAGDGIVAPAPKSQKTDSNVENRELQEKKSSNTSQTKSESGTSSQNPSQSSFDISGNSRRSNSTIEIRNSYMHPLQQHSVPEREAWLTSNDQAVDVDEIVSSTQSAASNDELFLYGDLPTKIVGIRFYSGMANPGEYILMRREPGNPYDSNAIRVDNVGGQQIGHIPRRMAEKLAKYMDRGWLFLEGRLAGSIGTFDCPLEVNMYGPDYNTNAGQQLASKMAADKLPLGGLKAAKRTESERQKKFKQQQKEREQAERKWLTEQRKAAAFATSSELISIPMNGQNYEYSNQMLPDEGGSQLKMEDLIEASQHFNPRDIVNSTDNYCLQEETLKKMPSTEKPDSIKTDMLPHQLQALKWLLDQENPHPPPSGCNNAVQLWKRHDIIANAFTNLATNHSIREMPSFASGGILADDMGLGKTLEMISLIVADAERNGRGTTLVVAPLSVMSNWSVQIENHVRKNKALSVYIYHGSARVAMNPTDFGQFDVVITTYQTLASDYMPKDKGTSGKLPERNLRTSGLYSVKWRRVILDEGHNIRNPSSKGAAACNALIARSKWVLTGTPIVNSLKDLYSLLRFIGVTGGLEQIEVFNSVLVRPLKQGDSSATFLLQAIMTAFTLRRRKDMAFIDLRLPKLDEYVHRIDFTAKERERYEAFYMQAKNMLKSVENMGHNGGESRSQQYAHLLEILLRMRQCCNHWELCSERVTNLMSQLERQKTVVMTPENAKALQEALQLQIESQEDCPICFETLHNPVITNCGHFFGRGCIMRAIEDQHRCPMCRAELRDESVLVGPAIEGGDQEADNEMDLMASSSKLECMMEILAATRLSGKGEKTIIFSQWTRFLDIVQARLDREGYKYCRLDGTMAALKRDAALEALENDDKCTIMLASLGVCAVGLNLTAANQIVLSDTWWAPAIEDQAVDRVHRLGQKRETRVFRLVMDGSIEEKTIVVQAEKRKLMQLAFSERENKRQKAVAGRLADIQKLLA